MKTLLISTILLSCTAASAKSHPASDYQDAVLVSFRDVANGSTCDHTASTSGDVSAHTDDDGNTSGTVTAKTTGTSACKEIQIRHYTLRVADHTYVVQPAYVFLNRSTFLLLRERPGTNVQVRFDKKGLFVRLNNKESKFDVVEAK
jgi:hypothetical protein